MGFTVLERIFTTERYRQRASGTAFSTPALQECVPREGASPLLASNMRGAFLPTRVSAQGVARYGFLPCSISEEPVLLTTLYRTLLQLSAQQKWPNRCSSSAQALERMRSFGLEPRFLVISESLLRDVCGQEDLAEAQRAMASRGSIAVVGDLQVLLSELPAGSAIVTASPLLTGLYTRVGDHLGILAQRVDRSIVLVEP